MSHLRTAVRRASGLVVASVLALATGAPPAAAQDLLLELEQALSRLEEDAAPAATASAEGIGATGPAEAKRPLVAVGPLRSALAELERKYAAQRKAFDAVAVRKDLPPRAHERLRKARAAHERGQGRLIALLRELAGEETPAPTATLAPPTARERRPARAPEEELDSRQAAAAAAEARAILVRMREAARRQPLSGELKVRAPRLQRTLAEAEAGRVPTAATAAMAAPAATTATETAAEGSPEDTPEPVPAVLQQVADGLAGPVEVFEWVRNTIRPELYYGRMKGALQTHLEGGGNDADTASLLIALLRAKGIPARYARATAELTAAELQAVTGTATPERALDALVRAGVPHEAVTGASGLAAVRMDRIWAEAYLPYDNYRGNLLDPHGKFWIPLDSGLKRFSPPTGIDVVRELGFDARAALEDYLSVPRTQTPLEFLRARVGALLAAERPGTVYADALNSSAFLAETLGILPGVLPYKVIGTPAVGLVLGDELEHSVRFRGETESGSILDVTLPLPDVLGRRLTLAYVPATAEDEAVVARFGGMLATPAYLFDVKPVLRSRGVAVSAGAGQIGMAMRYRLRVEIRGPGGLETIDNEVLAGNLTAIGLGGSDPAGAETAESEAAQILSGRAWGYLARWNQSDEELARLLHVVPVRPTASLCFVMSDVRVDYAGGDPAMPLSFDWQGLLVDADLRATAPVGVRAAANEKAFLLLSGLEGSVLEHRILEDDLGLASISTAKALALARDQGIALHDLTSDNVDDVLPLLNLDPSVREEVLEATARGLLARVPAGPLTYIDWTGVGYLLLDEETGESAYQLQGGHSGGSTADDPDDVPPDVRDPLAQQGEEPAPEGAEVAAIRKFEETDLQEGIVNETLPRPLRVLVTDEAGRPIPGAPVTFLMVAGSGKLLDPVLGDGRTQVTVFSNEAGEAEIRLILGKQTWHNSVFVRLEGDEFETQVGLDEVVVRSGNVVMDSRFFAYGYPDDRNGARMWRTSPDVTQAVDNLKVSGFLITVVAGDGYNNPLANVPIRFAFSGPPGPTEVPAGKSRLRPVKEDSPGLVLKSDDLSACLENGLAQQLRGECPGEAPEVVVNTYRWGGAQAFAVLGDSPWSYYRYRITSDREDDRFQPGAQSEIYVFFFTWGPLCNNPDPTTCSDSAKPLHSVDQGTRRILTGVFGGIGEAYPVGAQAEVSFWATALIEKETILADGEGNFTAMGTNEWEVTRLYDSEFTLTPQTAGTEATPNRVTSAGADGYYRARMRMSPTPMFNRLGYSGRHYPWVVPYLENGNVDPSYVEPDGSGGFRLRERVKDRTRPELLSGGTFPLWGIRPFVGNLDPSPVLLDAAGLVMRPSQMDVVIEPAEEFGRFYSNAPVEIKRVSDGEVAASGFSDNNRGVVFPVGLGLRPEPHVAKTWVADQSPHAVVPTPRIESTPYPVPVCTFLKLSTPRVLVRRIEDRANNRVCGNEGRIVFSLCEAAKVSLLGQGIDLEGHVEPFDSQCQEGVRPPPAPILDVELGPGEYQIILPLADSADFEEARPFLLKAVLLDDPEIFKEEPGEIQNRVENRAVLPVGHTFVKGVDLLEGHVVQQATDLKVPGRHLGLELVRTYSSASRRPDDVLGAGWSMNYTPSLTEDFDCRCVNLRTADGSGQVFQTEDWTTFTPQKGYHGQLIPLGLGGYIYVDKSGTRHTFVDTSGRQSRACPSSFRLLGIEDPHGDRIVPTYDARGRIVRVSEVHPERTSTPEGGVAGEVRALLFAFDFVAGFDRLVSAEIPALRLKVTYEYDGFGNLTRVARSGQNLDEARPAADAVWQYQYSTGDFRDRSQLLVAIDPNGARTEYRYYQADDPFPGETVDFRGGGFFFPFDKREYVKEVIEFASTGSTVVSYVTSYRYDVSRLLSDQEAVTTVRDALGRETVYTLNRNGSPLRIAEPLGRTTLTEWAANDVLKLAEIDPLGRRTEYGYDPRGNLTLETIRTADLGDVVTSYTYDPAFNKLASKTDAEDRLTSYTIGPRGDLLDSEDAVGNVTTYGYDDQGRLTSVRDPRGHTTTHLDFDSFGHAQELRDPLGNVTRREYDARGRLVRETDSFGREARTLYDGLDRPVEVTRVAGGDSADEVTLTEYFPGGQPRVVTNALGAATTYTLDGLNRVVATSTELEDETLTTLTEYDGVSNKVLERDRRGVDRSHTYDELNRLVRAEITQGVGSERPLGVIATYGYDLVGNKLFETNLAALRTDFIYDGLYRVVQKTLPEGPSAGQPYREAFTYDKVGNRLTATDANDHTTTFRYDDLNRLIRTENALGHVSTVTYADPEGSHVNRTEDHDTTRGLRTTYAYDALNRETERRVFLEGTGGSGEVYASFISYDDGAHGITATDPRGTATRTVLNGLDRPVETVVDPGGLDLVTSTVYDGLGNKTATTDPNRRTTTFRYDRLGRLVEMRDALEQSATYEYDGEGRKTAETDRRGVRREFTYDNIGRPRKTTLVPVPALSGVPWSSEVEYQDVARRRIETDARGFRTTFVLDGLDRVTTLIDPDDFRVVSEWDGVNKTSETDKRGHTTRFEYDPLNRLTRVTDPPPFATQTVVTAFDDENNRRTETDRRDIAKVTQTDPLGRVKTVTDAGITLETNTYDPSGNRESTRDAEGKETRFAYDRAHRLSARTDGYGSPAAAITTFGYDNNGNLLEERDPRAAHLGEPFSVKRTYDELNRLKTEENGEADTTTYDYDPEGNRILVQEPEGHETRFAFDELGKLTKVTQPSVGGTTPVTSYDYDRARNRIRQEDANANVVEMTYDKLNRLDTFVQRGAPGGDLTTDHDYDPNGNEITLTDPKGQVVRSVYDQLNRLDERTYEALPGDVAGLWRHTTRIDYGYDRNSNLTLVDESTASGLDPPSHLVTERTYDDLDRLRSEVAALPDGGTKTVGYSYFRNGTRETVTDPELRVTAYTYDGQNRLATATTESGTLQARTTTYTYEPDDLLETVSYPNGVVANHSYDKADRLLSVVNTGPSGLVSAFEYQGTHPVSGEAVSYDKNGNRLIQVERNGGLTEITTYSYDDLNRLSSVTYPVDSAFPAGRAVTYTYDAVGNRVRELEQDSVGTVLADKQGVFDSLNRLTSLTDLSRPDGDPDRLTLFTWDNNGNQLTKAVGATTTEYRYDVRDKLVEVQLAGAPAPLSRFQYDFEGRRNKKIGEGLPGDQVRQYVYDQTSLLAEYNVAGASVAKYDYGSDRLISLLRTDEPRRYFHLDGLRSVVNLTDDLGASQASYHLDSWGNFRFPTELESSRNRFAFTGHYFDTETELYFAKARYLDPELGRFISQDSYLGEAQDPPSLHRYFYAHNNPLFFVDPNGHSAQVAAVQQLRRRLEELSRTVDEKVQAASAKLGEYGMGVSIAAAHLIAGINSPGHNPTREYLESLPQPQTDSEARAAIIADLAFTASPLLAKGLRGETSAGMRPGARPARQTGADVGAPATSPKGPAGQVVAETATPGGTTLAESGGVPKPQGTLSEPPASPAQSPAAAAPAPPPRPSAPVVGGKAQPQQTFVTYVLRNENGEVVYVGRASGYGTPEQVMQQRLGKGHHIYENNPGLKPEVKAVQDSKEASMGAEQVWYEYYKKEGAPLLNDPATPPLSAKPSKAAQTQERIDKYSEDVKAAETPPPPSPKKEDQP